MRLARDLMRIDQIDAHAQCRYLALVGSRHFGSLQRVGHDHDRPVLILFQSTNVHRAPVRYSYRAVLDRAQHGYYRGNGREPLDADTTDRRILPVRYFSVAGQC